MYNVIHISVYAIFDSVPIMINYTRLYSHLAVFDSLYFFSFAVDNVYIDVNTLI